QRKAAEQQRDLAEQQRVAALAGLATTERLRGDWDTALRLGVHAASLAQRLGGNRAETTGARAALSAAVWQSGWRLVLSGHEDALTSARFSPDGSRLATASWDYTARIWEAATGNEILVLRGHKGTVTSAAFSPDGAHIVTASDDDTARIWDMATGK